jgi:hypothetical protein
LRVAKAQTYPTRPVRIIVGFAPGGGVDIIARLMGQWLSERLSQPFVVENRPGAATNIGTEAVVRGPPDGYTVLLVSTTGAINATFYNKLNFRGAMRDPLSETDRCYGGHEPGATSVENLRGCAPPPRRSGQLADYYPVIAQAVDRLEPSTAETRRTIYNRARAAMVARLRSLTPSLSESDIISAAASGPY